MRGPADERPPEIPSENKGLTAFALYLHPTTDRAVEARSADPLTVEGGPVDDAVRFQATVLNGVARIWAPRFRQASRGALAAGGALAPALEDVTAAFDHALAQSPPDAPFFLLGHDQGAMLLLQLLRARVVGTPLARRLVVAYLAGLQVDAAALGGLPICADPRATGCAAVWATARAGVQPAACGVDRCPPASRPARAVCFNPVTGGPGPGAPGEHRGAGPGGGLLGGSFAGFAVGLVATRCGPDGVLQVDDAAEADGLSARDLVGVDGGDYHAQDVNLFYLDLRADAATRLAAFEGRAH